MFRIALEDLLYLPYEVPGPFAHWRLPEGSRLRAGAVPVRRWDPADEEETREESEDRAANIAVPAPRASEPSAELAPQVSDACSASAEARVSSGEAL